MLCFLFANITNAQDNLHKRSTSPLAHPNLKPLKHNLTKNNSPVITFSEYPLGTVITNQYENVGIIFGGSGDDFITEDAANPTSPVLSGTPQFLGDITGTFVVPGTNTPTTVKSFMLDAGYFDYAGTTCLEWYDAYGNLLGRQINSQVGIETFTIEAEGIASFLIKTLRAISLQ